MLVTGRPGADPQLWVHPIVHLQVNDQDPGDHRNAKVAVALGAASVAVATTQLLVANLAGVVFACLFVVAGGLAFLWRRFRAQFTPVHGFVLAFVVIGAAGAGAAVARAFPPGKAQPAAQGTSSSPSPSRVSPTASQSTATDACRPEGSFASPRTNARIDTSTQVRGSGRLCANQTLWVLIKEGGNVWVQGKDSMTVSNDEWSSAMPAKTCENYCAKQVVFFLVVTDPEDTGSIKMALSNAAQHDGARLPEIPVSAHILDRVPVIVQQ